MTRIRSGADKALGIFHTMIPVLLVVGAFGTISYAVLARHFLHQPLGAANEIAQIASVWIVMLGCGLAIRRSSMIVIGVTPPRFEARFSGHLEIPRRIVHILVLVGLAYPSLQMLLKTTQEYDFLGVSRMWGVAALPAGFVLAALVLVIMPRQRDEETI